MQIECPSDCTWLMASLAPVLSHNVSSATPANPLAGAAVYATPSPVCLAARHASLVMEPIDDRTVLVNANPTLPIDQQSPLYLNSLFSYGSGFATLGPAFPSVLGVGGALGAAQGYTDAGGNGVQSSGVNDVGCAASLDVMVAIEAGDTAANAASERIIIQTIASAWVRTLGMGGSTTAPGSRVALMRYSAASLSVDASLANTSPAIVAAALSSIASPFLASLAAGGASTVDYNRVLVAVLNQFLQNSVQVTGLKVLVLFATNAPAVNFSSSVRFVCHSD